MGAESKGSLESRGEILFPVVTGFLSPFPVFTHGINKGRILAGDILYSPPPPYNFEGFRIIRLLSSLTTKFSKTFQKMGESLIRNWIFEN